jgi:SCY1-like protein 1
MVTLGFAPRFCSSCLISFLEPWLILRVKIALAFLNDPCSSTHGSVTATAIFISQSGEWKLGGFELLSNPKEEAAVLYVRDMASSLPGCSHVSLPEQNSASLLPGSMNSAPPEVKKTGWHVLKQ